MKHKFILLIVMSFVGIATLTSQIRLNTDQMVDIKVIEEETRNMVEQFYLKTSEGDIDEVINMMSDDIIWNLPGNKGVAPWVGIRKGKGEVRDFYALLQQHTLPLEFIVETIFISGNQAVSIGQLSTKMLKTNRIYNTHFTTSFTIEDQKISNYLFLEDSWGLTKKLEIALPESFSKLNIIQLYFESVEVRDFEKMYSLFSEDVEIYFPHTGILNGIESLKVVNEEFVRSFNELKFDMDKFIYTESGDRLIVEGIENGIYANGERFDDERFCSVFEFQNGLIIRMYAYPYLKF